MGKTIECKFYINDGVYCIVDGFIGFYRVREIEVTVVQSNVDINYKIEATRSASGNSTYEVGEYRLFNSKEELLERLQK